MWVRPSEIGTKATLQTVQDLTTELKANGLEFYTGVKTWQIPAVVLRRPGQRWIASCMWNVIRLDKVRGFYDADMDFGFDVPDAVLQSRSVFRYAGVQRYAYYELTGVRGLAVLTALAGAETLQRGDSVIREDREIVIDDPADYSWMQGDQLASRPPGLTSALQSMGRRIIYEAETRRTGKDVAEREFEENWERTLRQWQVVKLI